MRPVIFATLFISSLFAFDCAKDETLKRYKETSLGLDFQIAEVKKLISGEANTKLSPTQIFGSDFNPADSAQAVDKIKRLNKEKFGLPPELSHLDQCLLKNELLAESKVFRDKSFTLNELKVELIEKNTSLGNFIKSSLDSGQNLPSLKNKIKEDKKDAESLKKDLVEQAYESSKEALSEDDVERKEYLLSKSLFEKNKIEIINIGLAHTQALEEAIQRFERDSKTLKQISNSLTSQSTEEEIKNSFFKAQDVWKQATQVNFEQIFRTSPLIEFPKSPKIPPKPTNENLHKIYQDILKLDENTQLIKKKIIKEITDKKYSELKIQSTLLLQVNALRSNIFQRFRFSSLFGLLLKSDFYLSVLDEIKASPYRVIAFFYAKFLYVREQLLAGKEGVKALSFDFFGFSLLILMILFANFLIKKVYELLDKTISSLLTTYSRTYFLKNIVSVWNKLKDNFFFLTWLIIISFTGLIDVLAGYQLVLRVISTYFIYRIIRSFVVLSLGQISRLDLSSFARFKSRANSTASSLANIYLTYTVTMILVDGAVGRVFFYSLANFLALTFSIIRVNRAALEWDEELRSHLERHFSGVIVEKIHRTTEYFPKTLIPLFHLFCILFFSLINLFVKLTENFEISKKISANIFKKQLGALDSQEDQSETIPEDYKEIFSPKSLDSEENFVIPDDKIFESIKSDINEWLENDSEEHSLVVFGDKGVGKTTLLKQIIAQFENEYQGQLQTVMAKVPSKILDEPSLNQFIASLFETTPRENLSQTIEVIDKGLSSKMIVYLDEAQNVFLTKEQGFEAYYAFINLINAQTEKIFWALSFNKYSWLYLNRAFGRNDFFRNVYELRGWNDVKVKDLIMKRHSGSGFYLSYDTLINATRSQEEIDRYSSVESKFFKLLWEMSNGNPRLALFLWLSALSRKTSRGFNVNLPKYREVSGIERFNDDFLFMIASIIKHENLSAKELEFTSNTNIGIIRNNLKLAMERKLLFKDGRSRFVVDISAQHQLIKHLRSKNFLYGN